MYHRFYIHIKTWGVSNYSIDVYDIDNADAIFRDEIGSNCRLECYKAIYRYPSPFFLTVFKPFCDDLPICKW